MTVIKKPKSPKKSEIKRVQAACWDNGMGCGWKGKVSIIDGTVKPRLCPKCKNKHVLLDAPFPGFPLGRQLHERPAEVIEEDEGEE